MKILKNWSVKELVIGYGDLIPDLNVDMHHHTALQLVIDHEADSFNEKYAKEIKAGEDAEEMEFPFTEDDDIAAIAQSIPQH